MQYAERLPNTRSMVAPVVALVIGAAAATGTYALIDNDQVQLPEPKVVVNEAPNEAPLPPSLAAKQKAESDAAIGRTVPNSFFGKDEAATAAAIGRPGTTEVQVNPSTGFATPSTARPVGIPSPAAAAKMNSEVGSGTASKDEAATAAAIGSGAPQDEHPLTSRIHP
jgi:hypothetical protein